MRTDVCKKKKRMRLQTWIQRHTIQRRRESQRHTTHFTRRRRNTSFSWPALGKALHQMTTNWAGPPPARPLSWCVRCTHRRPSRELGPVDTHRSHTMGCGEHLRYASGGTSQSGHAGALPRRLSADIGRWVEAVTVRVLEVVYMACLSGHRENSPAVVRLIVPLTCTEYGPTLTMGAIKSRLVYPASPALALTQLITRTRFS